MIKFRAWDKRTEEMWNVETLHIEDESYSAYPIDEKYLTSNKQETLF